LPEWPAPPPVAGAEAGFDLVLVALELDPTLETAANAAFDPVGECPPLTAAVAFGAATTLLARQLEDADIVALLRMPPSIRRESQA